jgi:acyl-CoA synthetase (NDP forming)
MNREHVLKPFLTPRSIALFGSMREGQFFGAGVIIKDLLKGGYTGTLYPIHPSADTVYGKRVYRTLQDIDTTPELAVIITSYRNVPDILHQCGSRGIRSVIVVSDGFAEIGPEGERRQKGLLAIAASYGMRIIGPNTVGIFNAADAISTVPYDRGYHYNGTGKLSVITQTGMYGPQAMAWNEYRPGVNKVIDLGNMSDVDETDCLEYLEQDDGTGVISMYIEHSRRPRILQETAKRVSLKKPILCLKPGISPGAATAMASHTGSLAGNENLYRGLFNQSGIIRVEEYEDLRDCTIPFIRYPLPRGNRLGVITFSGAIGIQCIDTAEASGLTLGTLSDTSKESLTRVDRSLSGHPIDVGPASATAGEKILTIYQQAFDILAAEKNIDCIYVNTYVSHVVRPEYYKELLQHIGSVRDKPIVAWSYGTSRKLVEEFALLAESCGIPFFFTTRKAIRSLGYMVRYSSWKRTVG